MADERHGGERAAQEDGTRGDDRARTPPIGQPAGGKADDAIAERVEREHARDAGAAPAELVEQRGEEDAETVLGPVSSEEHDEGGGDDSPAVKDHVVPFVGTPFFGRPFLDPPFLDSISRSEERRVGKECRYWWSR